MYALEESFTVAEDPQSLIAYRATDSKSSKSIKQNMYDFMTNQVKEYKVKVHYTYRFNGS